MPGQDIRIYAYCMDVSVCPIMPNHFVPRDQKEELLFMRRGFRVKSAEEHDEHDASRSLPVAEGQGFMRLLGTHIHNQYPQGFASRVPREDRVWTQAGGCFKTTR